MNPELAEMENEEFVNILRQQIRGLENQKVQLTAKLTEVSNRLTHAKKLMEAYVPETANSTSSPNARESARDWENDCDYNCNHEISSENY